MVVRLYNIIAVDLYYCICIILLLILFTCPFEKCIANALPAKGASVYISVYYEICFVCTLFILFSSIVVAFILLYGCPLEKCIANALPAKGACVYTTVY